MAMAVEGGGTLSEIHQSAKKLLMKARDGVEKLERLESSTSTGGYDSPELSFAVKKDISQIQSLCVEMDRLWRSISFKSQRDLWRSCNWIGILNYCVLSNLYFNCNYQFYNFYSNFSYRMLGYNSKIWQHS
ncbi:hypothetical protein Patl1_26345 [Pistacia atlantica]|uniref:Uncharacterized protein n=1 Tax=Pistacia atlantica TaxID=434234 RepID=A0ACC1B2D0_9ROSI|nr:hypothetical protein Patl1_26345 [Pistacia atlantica]